MTERWIERYNSREGGDLHSTLRTSYPTNPFREFLQAAELPEDFPRRLEVGSPAEMIAKLLEAKDALVVIGSHGASAITAVLLGSTARRILNQISADVLVVPFTERDLA